MKNHLMAISIFITLISILHGCGIITGNVFQPPIPAGEWYQKPGATKTEINIAEEACIKRSPDNQNLDNVARSNNYFKQRFCMEDQGYLPRDGTRAINSCKNFINPKIPICEARGAYK